MMLLLLVGRIWGALDKLERTPKDLVVGQATFGQTRFAPD